MRRLILCLFFLLCASPAWSATRWVAATGGTTGSCATAQGTSDPGTYLRTIAAGIACLAGSDVLMIKAGTYVESFYDSVPAGTASAPTTIIAAPGNTVTIRQPAIADVPIFYFGGTDTHHVTVDGNTHKGLILDGNSWHFIFRMDTGANNITVQNAELKNAGHSCVVTGSEANANFLTFRNLSIHDCGLVDTPGQSHGLYITSDDNLMEYLHIYNQKGYCFHLTNSLAGKPDRNIVRYSVAENCQIGRQAWTQILDGTDHVFHNNIIRGPNPFGLRTWKTGHRVFNNVFYGITDTAVSNDDNSSSVQIRNNIVMASGNNFNGTATYSNNLCDDADAGCTIVGAPGFVNAAAGDFNLLPSSPALNAGIAIGAGCTGNNCAGAFNGTAPEIGAHEIPVIASASVEAATPNQLWVNWAVNTSAFQPIACPTTVTNFVVRVDGSPRAVSGCAVSGTTQMRLTFATPNVTSSNVVTFDYTAGTVRDTADIGRGTGAVGTGKNQKAFSCTNCAAVANRTAGGGGHTAPVFGSAEVANATPTIVKFCASTNETGMNPATGVTGFTITNKTISSAVRNSTDSKCFDLTVSPAFAAGAVETITYNTGTGNVVDNHASPLELIAFTGEDITNNVVGSGATGLVAHYKLDETGSTTTAVDTISANNGTLAGFSTPPTWTPGPIEGALSFDGSNDHVTMGTVSGLNITGTTLSVALWAKATAPGNYRYLVSKTNSNNMGYALYTGSTGTLRMYVGTTASGLLVSDPVSVSPWDGQWHHIVGVFNGSTIRIYIDGVQSVSTAASGTIATASAQNFTLGIFSDVTILPFPGTLDDVRVYNTELSAAQVQALHAPGPIFASAVVDNATANVVKVCTSTNDPPLTPATGCLGFSVTGHSLTSCARTGAADPDHKCMNLAVSPAFVNGEDQRTVTYDMVTGDVKSSGSGTPELLQFTANVTNNVQPPCAATPLFGDASVDNATPTIVKVCALTNNPPMLPATNALGFTITGKTITARAINATDNKCMNLTVSAAFTGGAEHTIAYDPATGDVTSSGNCLPELETFTGRAITNGVAVSGGPTGSFAVVENASPGIVKVCTSTNDPPLLPANNCALAGFTVDGHTVTDCDRTGASDPNYKCMNLAVTPDFINGEVTQTLAYNQAGGDVTSSAGGFPELVAFSGMQITNLVQPGGSVSRDQELCWIECWGGPENSPDCHFTAQTSQVTYPSGCFRVRCSIHNEGTAVAGSQGYTWYASKNGAAYAQVSDTPSAGNIWFATPPELGSVPTTEQITSTPATFTPGKVLLSTATPPLPAAGDPAFGPGMYTEIVGGFCLDSGVIAGADCTAADDWQLEIRQAGGAPLETYTVRPRMCVASAITIHQ